MSWYHATYFSSGEGTNLLSLCSFSFFDSLTWAPNLAALVSERGDSDDLVPLELLAAAVVPPDADEGAAAVSLAGVLALKQSCPRLKNFKIFYHFII